MSELEPVSVLLRIYAILSNTWRGSGNGELIISSELASNDSQLRQIKVTLRGWEDECFFLRPNEISPLSEEFLVALSPSGAKEVILRIKASLLATWRSPGSGYGSFPIKSRKSIKRSRKGEIIVDLGIQNCYRFSVNPALLPEWN
ncbi:hypothetical protein [Nodosilinea sp. E11]|uniref:hypothetical protein n=1 Tax=Nodosilinea sp. E11 TaxID=3037479 RepID=UPI002934C8FE|nr:hypothetical protein [Nodosilinea sp. E11]WOD37328.1 hypothetical protein RRF56_02395 [Nodosilinea sp. E11]